ncbi:Septum formation [Micromonospora matsumotoense]|uniref:Septum formation n=1 Tax=Micromonospora matsumotoense TaxID=121616 RepID=A0A1C5AS75_9ACTN|nr:septum formation family protein [Micromonospora matsumotoense]SCF48058.1 Septum formation [Micromonospora matsumotoense]
MRRCGTAVATVAAAALALAGCVTPAGVDRDLTDEWPALAVPQVFVPTEGVCHTGVQDVGYLSGGNPVDCAGTHHTETMHVGILTGAPAGLTAPPATGSPAVRAVRAECDREVRREIGADWRAGRLGLTVVLPSAQGWTGGARWFRCDLGEISSIDEPGIRPRTGSLRGALADDTGLGLGCFNPKVTRDDVRAMKAVSCTAPHHAEFVGVWQAPDVSYAEFRRTADRTHRGCLGLIARHTGVPDNGDLKLRAGSIYYHPVEREWRSGNHGVQCFLWLSDRTLTRTLKNAGPHSLPLR